MPPIPKAVLTFLASLHSRANALWDAASRSCDLVAGLLFVAGLSLFGASILMGLNNVRFDGHLKYGAIQVTSNGSLEQLSIVKQVGYAWAPNWGLTGLFLLPAAVLCLLRAKNSIEPLLHDLIRRHMLVNKSDLSPADATLVLSAWRLESGRWMFLALPLYLFIAFSIFFGDFIPVVAKWIFADPKQLASLASRISLQHASFEFDWSVASIFKHAEISKWPNFIFSLSAYLIIPMIGAPLLFSGFVWFLCFPSFLYALERKDVVLVPSLASEDRRLGFEAFERVFNYLVCASLLTAIINLCMHLQNVYLRSPVYKNIIEMVFGEGVDKILTALRDWSPKPFLNYLTSMTTALRVDLGELSPQSYAAIIAILLMCAIMMVSLWIYLRTSAIDGIARLKASAELNQADEGRLDDMDIWPVGWLSLNLYISAYVVIGASMWFVNLPSLILFYFIGRSVQALYGSLLDYTKVYSRKKGSRTKR